MADGDNDTCLELALEGEKLCKAGKCRWERALSKLFSNFFLVIIYQLFSVFSKSATGLVFL
jgi:hypothetical protein